MNQLLKVFLYPFSLIYGFVTATRNILYDLGIFKSYDFETPVICVGNLSVGGTGKTPHIIYLLKFLKEKGLRVAVLSRGYGRKSRGFVLANEKSTAGLIGDEPMEILNRFPDVTVAVCNSRVEGARKLLAMDQPPEVILLDDAMQHRAIRPGHTILLTTYQRPYFRDLVLPAGRLREFSSGSKRADSIVLTKCPPEMTASKRESLKNKLGVKGHQNLFFSSIYYKGLYRLGEPNSLFTGTLEKFKVYLISAIASNTEIIRYLKEAAESLEVISYPDHYDFQPEELQKNSRQFANDPATNKIIVTTEKDAVKLIHFDFMKELPVYVLSMEIKVRDEDLFRQSVMKYLDSNNH